MKKWLAYFLFVSAILFLFFFHAGQIPLWSSDEGRFGEIAREMWKSKNFVIPTFNYVIYLEKPILAPLLTSFAYGVFGVNAFGTRLFPILSALLGILMTFLFTKKLFNLQIASAAATVLATTFGYVLVGRFAVIDMIMTLLLTGCLFSFLSAYLLKQARYYLIAYVFMGLAFLTKGLFGIVVPGLIYFAFLLWQKDLKEITKMRLGWGVLIIAAVILPWVIAISLKKSDFLRVFFWEQQFQRFLTGSFGRKRPFWFFVPILFATAFPWSLFLPSAAVNGLKKANPYHIAARFLFCWIAVIFVFFSIPKSKLPYYLLPLSPAVAVLIGGLFSVWGNRFSPSEKERKIIEIILKILIIVFFVAAFAGNIVFLFLGHREESERLAPLVQCVSIVLILGGLAVYFVLRRKPYEQTLLPLAGTVYGTLLLTIAAMEVLTPFQSTYAYAEFLKSKLQPSDRIALYASPDKFSDFPFHLKRRVLIAGSNRGTLTDQSHLLNAKERDTWFLNSKEFGQLFLNPSERVFCLMEAKKFDEFKRETGIQEPYILKNDSRKILLSNRP